jgi:hypothetical protein
MPKMQVPTARRFMLATLHLIAAEILGSAA